MTCALRSFKVSGIAHFQSSLYIKDEQFFQQTALRAHYHGVLFTQLGIQGVGFE